MFSTGCEATPERQVSQIPHYHKLSWSRVLLTYRPSDIPLSSGENIFQTHKLKLISHCVESDDCRRSWAEIGSNRVRLTHWCVREEARTSLGSVGYFNKRCMSTHGFLHGSLQAYEADNQTACQNRRLLPAMPNILGDRLTSVTEGCWGCRGTSLEQGPLVQTSLWLHNSADRDNQV